jgi:dissimilatory sulfite reductase related protein
MIPADNHRDAALASVELNDEGFFLHPEQWTEAMVPTLAARVGISELSDRHWQVIRFTRNQFLEHGMGPTVRLIGKASGVSIRELYRLFPRSPSYVAARIAGVPKLYLCQNGSWLKTARVAALRAAAH